MAYVAPTVDQFKGQFFRDFMYSVPSFGATGTATVNSGAVSAVTLTSGGMLYQATPLCVFSGGGGTGATATATVTSGAVSGITLGSGGSGYTSAPSLSIVSADGDDTDISKVTNTDITAALAMVGTNLPNQGLFPSQGNYATGYGLLAAHYLVTNLLNSTQGVNSQYDWITTQRTVGNVNTSHQAPDWVKNDPFLSTLTATRYGALYLSLIGNYLRGNVRIVFGGTTA